MQKHEEDSLEQLILVVFMKIGDLLVEPENRGRPNWYQGVQRKSSRQLRVCLWPNGLNLLNGYNEGRTVSSFVYSAVS